MVIYPSWVEKKKKSPTFSLLMVLLSRFGPFWVWGVTHTLCEVIIAMGCIHYCYGLYTFVILETITYYAAP